MDDSLRILLQFSKWEKSRDEKNLGAGGWGEGWSPGRLNFVQWPIPQRMPILPYTRWFKYDRDKLWLVYTQSVPVIFEPPCILLHMVCQLNESVLLNLLLVGKNCRKISGRRSLLGVSRNGKIFLFFYWMRGRSRRRKLLDDVKEIRRYWNLKE
jgi:hypothetical protein